MGLVLTDVGLEGDISHFHLITGSIQFHHGPSNNNIFKHKSCKDHSNITKVDRKGKAVNVESDFPERTILVLSNQEDRNKQNLIQDFNASSVRKQLKLRISICRVYTNVRVYTIGIND